MAALDLIQFVCPSCGHGTQVPAISAGSAITCPGCKTQQKVTLPDQEPAATPPPASAMPAPPVSFTPSGGNPIIDDGKKLFICTCCSYRARIPAQYLGMAVRCPSCDAPQIASGDDNATRSGRTVSITKMQSATTQAKMSSIRPGNILFTCNLCGFEAQLAQHYLGKAIRCPGCHAAQVVAEGVTAKSPGSAAPAPAPAQPPPAPTAPAQPPATPPAADVAAEPGVAPTSHDGQPLFVCSACGYRARIPDQYLGLAVTCPSCEVVQIANQQSGEPAPTGNTQRLTKLKTSDPVEPAAIAADADKVPFTCTACGFNTHLGASLAGKAIRCPSCQATQVVPGRHGAGFDKPSPIPAAMSAGAPPAADKVRFTCTACGFKARIPAHYAGQVIHCPGCNGVQLVVASALASSGNTRVLAKVQTAEGRPAAPTTAEDLKSVSSALEASSTRVAPPMTPPMGPGSRTPPEPQATVPPPIARPATGRVARTSGTDRVTRPATAPIARPVTGRVARTGETDRLTRPGAAPVAMPTEVRSGGGQAPVNQSTAQPLTDSHRPGTGLVERPEVGLAAQPSTDLFAQGDVVDETPQQVSGKVVRRNGTSRHPSDAAIPAPRPAPIVVKGPPAENQDTDMPAPTPARSSPILGILLAVVALAIIGGMGYVLLDMSRELKAIRLDLKQAQADSRASEQKREAAEKAAEKEKTDAARRIEEIQRQLKAAEDKAALEKAERERIEKEKADAAAKAAAAPATPAPVPPPAK